MRIIPYKKYIDGIGTVMLFNLVDDEVRQEHQPVHYIQIIDRSASMRNDINTLIDQVKQTIVDMSEKDYYSVIWFSGRDQYKTVLKGVPRSGDISGSLKVLDSLKSTIGLTCFYQATADAFECIRDLRALAYNSMITLFTDGQSTVDGDNNNMSELLESLNDVSVSSFNTVGYGNYCDETKLRIWSNYSEFGVYTHSSRIEEYYDIFKDNSLVSKSLFPYVVDIEVESNDGPSRLYYVTPVSSTLVRVGESYTGDFNYLNRNKNQFVLVHPDKDPDIKITFNDYDKDKATVINSRDIKNSIRDIWVNGILYRKAYADYYSTWRDESLQCLKVLRDKELIDSHMSSFTTNEVANHIKELKKTCRKVMYRHPNTCDNNYVPRTDAPCVMDLLNILNQSDNNLYDHSAEYNRIGRKVSDDLNRFFKDDNDKTSPISNLVFNEKKLNVSIRFPIKGYVHINPRQADRVGLDPKVPCMIFRTHTIIKDGQLNMSKILVVVDRETLDKINDKFSDPDLIESCTQYSDSDVEMYSLVLNLETIPMINAQYSNLDIIDVRDYVVNIERYKSRLKVLNYLISNYDKKVNIASTDSSHHTYTDAQLELMKDYGIKDGVYSGISNSINSAEDSDYYYSRTMSFSLKGFSKLSPVEKVLEDITYDKVKSGDNFMAEYIDYIDGKNLPESSDTYKFYLEEHDKYSKRLEKYRRTLCINKIARVLTGSFLVGFVRDPKKDDRYTYTDASGYTVIMRTSLDKTYF